MSPPSDVAARFATQFGAPPSSVAWAPGRVNIIGEHTDYQDGYVLPMALARGITTALRPVDGARARLRSDGIAGSDLLSFDIGAEQIRGVWIDYVQGVSTALREAGHRIRGFDAFVCSDLPAGAGLASSAALEVSVLRALREAFSLAFDDVMLARLAWRAETAFVGVPVGVMDQMASSLGTPGAAMFLDTRSLAWEPVPLPPAVRVLVIDSGIAHRNAESGYRERRRQVEDAARRLGVSTLRDLSPDELPRMAALPEPLFRRARHVLTENARVLELRAAAGAADVARMGALLAASHRSLRDDYEVSLPEIDRLVALAASTAGVLGARITGGGFGGAVVALVRTDRAADAAAEIARAYERETGSRALAIVIAPPAA